MSLSKEEQIELRERFNPEGSQLREYQKYLFKILCDFDRTCKELGIKYWLSQGTVLGAVRHGGFIPWDDDIDVEMLYPDYLKFCKLYKDDDNYVLQNIFKDPFYPLPFAKFRDKKSKLVDKESKITHLYTYKGAFIDIFYTEYRIEIVSRFLNYFFVAAAKSAMMIKNKNISKILIKIFTRIGWNGSSLMRVLLKKYSGKKMGLGYGSHFYDIKSEESDIFPLKFIEFEGKKFPVPHNCDSYLKKIYGDYMQLPNIENIKTHIVNWERLDCKHV